jgi:transposase
MLTDLPSDARDSIVKELHQNYWTAVATHKQFTLRNRSKKNSQSMNVRLRDYNREKGFYSFIKPIAKAELFPETEYDFKIHVDVDGTYYLIVTYKLLSSHPMNKLQRSKKTRRKHKLKLKKKKQKNARHQRVNAYQKTINPKIHAVETSENKEPQMIGGESQTPQVSERSLSGDPGCRTFLTCYTPDGYVYHLGLNDIQVLYRLFHYKNKLQGKISKSKGNHKRRMKKAWIRLSNRIHNLVDDFHKKTAKWLLDNFTTLIIPKLDVNQFSKKKTSKTTRNKMRLWRHCSFINCLKNKQRFYPKSQLIIPSEEYTSMTCSHCGCEHKTLGRNKTFLCPNPTCQRIFDRDVNASFNILLKTLTETTDVVL